MKVICKIVVIDAIYEKEYNLPIATIPPAGDYLVFKNDSGFFKNIKIDGRYWDVDHDCCYLDLGRDTTNNYDCKISMVKMYESIGFTEQSRWK